MESVRHGEKKRNVFSSVIMTFVVFSVVFCKSFYFQVNCNYFTSNDLVRKTSKKFFVVVCFELLVLLASGVPRVCETKTFFINIL